MQGLNQRRFQTKACIAGARTFLMLFNVIFWIIGFILLMFGLWMRVSVAKVFEISPHLNFALPSLLIISGAVMMFVGVIACFCSSTDSGTLLYILGGIFFLIFGLILATTIAGYAYRDNLKKQLYKSLNQSLEEYGTGLKILDRDLDRIQIHFECCGVDNYDDWQQTHWHTNTTLLYPDSCCRTLKQCDNNSTDQIHTDGCYTKLVTLFNENLSSVGLATFFISLFQLCGVTLAICLANHINKAQYEEMY